MAEVRNIRVLVIEDNEITVKVYQTLLSEVNGIAFELDTYNNMMEGIEAFNVNEYDVLLLDLNLPDSSQAETVQHIPAFSDKLPVIIMTITNSELIALQTVNLGSQDYLNKKGLEEVLLVRSILYAIERQQLKAQLKEEMEKTETQRDVSDKLLLNILPETIAQELKERGEVNARDFEMVSILFTDFKGFTAASEKLSAQDLVTEINTCFESFDNIMGKYGIEKIKTIGDAYMAAGGLPVPTQDSVKNTVKAALEMQAFITQRKAQKEAVGQPAFEMRAGIHTGAVVVGIVGIKKFQYDIWGDAVNTASRMESSSDVGQVNISQTTYNLLKDDSSFNFSSRGKIEVKGKGELEMWFVNGVG